MNMVKVVGINYATETLEFEDGITLTSEHKTECCEDHYLSLADLTLADFEGLEFDLTYENFFERIEGYGIALIPISGFPVRIPGYGSNNGWYSDNIDLVLSDGRDLSLLFDVSGCQVIDDKWDPFDL